LKEPKKDYEPKEAFVQRDFRGLLSADYTEAIKNSNLADVVEMGDIMASEGPFSKKVSTVNVKELFPVPMHNFSQKTMIVKPSQPTE
jgi:hypothetical protein